MENIIIGKVLKPQGIKGEIKVLPITDDVNRYKKLSTVFIGNKEYSVNQVKIRDDGVYLMIDGIDDRNAAEMLRNQMLSVSRDKAVKPKDGWLIVDLIGCVVFNDQDKQIGTLTDIMQNGCADVYCLDGGKIMFPALKKLLKSVDVDSKKIIIDSDVFSEVAVYED